MPQGASYIFALQDKDYRFWKIDSTGNVTISAQPYFLVFGPAGWADIEIDNVRNKKYWGIDRSVTSSMAFVMDAAKILKYIWTKKGVNEEVQLMIASLKLEYTPGVEYGYWYKQVFRGQVDWNTYNHSSSKVTVNSLEEGLAKYLKARENITYEFPLDVNREYVEMNGINLHEKLNFFDVDGIDFNTVNVGNQADGLTPTAYESKEGESVNIVYQTQSMAGYPTIAATVSSLNCLMQNVGDDPVTINLKGRQEIIGKTQTTNPWALRICFLTSSSTVATQNAYQVFANGFTVGEVVGADFNINITLQPGERLYKWGLFFAGISGNPGVEFTPNSKFSLSFLTRRQTTYIPVRNPADLFTEFIKLLTDNKYTADTTGLLTTELNKKFTSGNGLRNLDNALIKLSFSDYYKFWDVWKDAGMTILGNGKVSLQRKVDMIDYSTVTPLGAVSNLTVTTATDMLFNRIKIGFPDKQQEGINGREAFCNIFQWSVETLVSDKELDKTCNIITDCYSAELTRALFDGKDTTDSRQDNDTYCIHTEDTLQPEIGFIPAHYKLDRSLNASASGLLEPLTVFNLGLTPGRCFENNGAYFHSCLDLMETKKIKFQTASRNDKLVCGGLTEKADVSISTLAPQYFRPIYLEFDTPGSFDLLELLDTNPLRVFSFFINGETYIVLPEKLSITPAIGRKHRFKMLCGAGTDLTPLIDFYG